MSYCMFYFTCHRSCGENIHPRIGVAESKPLCPRFVAGGRSALRGAVARPSGYRSIAAPVGGRSAARRFPGPPTTAPRRAPRHRHHHHHWPSSSTSSSAEPESRASTPAFVHTYLTSGVSAAPFLLRFRAPEASVSDIFTPVRNCTVERDIGKDCAGLKSGLSV